MEDKERYAIGQQDFKTLRKNDAFVAETLRDADIDIEQTLNADWDLDDLAGLDLLNADPTALLYQAGYLTIAKYVYVIELKYNSTSDEALRQIDEKGYARRFAVDLRLLFKIGVNFSSESRRIESWKIES